MAVITGERLLERWRERLQRSDAADIAVAWATPCPAVDELREFCDRGGELRIVVGLAGNATDPTTLKELSKRAELRIGEASGGIFHPKYYCFRSSSRSTVWVGSANLTRAGFGANNELMLENAGTKGSGAWFERLWSSLVTDPQDEIDAYARNWKPSMWHQRPVSGRRSQRKQVTAAERLDASWSWDDFLSNLRAKDEEIRQIAERRLEEPWTVFGDHRSWMHTISAGRPIMRMRSWSNLAPWQVEILLGRTPWGPLGTLKGAGKAQKIIRGGTKADRDARQDILRHVRRASRSAIDATKAGPKAFDAITNRPRVGDAVATRLLALARPDCYVSVNKASRDGLASASGLAPTTIGNRYGALLQWVHESKWYRASQPSNPTEKEIWDCRAALVDVFVYQA